MAGNEYGKPRDYIRMSKTWTGKGWDFSALAMNRPENHLSQKERDCLFLREQFARAASAVRDDNNSGSTRQKEAHDLIDYVAIKTFFDTGGNISSLKTLSCLKSIDDLVDDMTIFLLRGGWFEAVGGVKSISTIHFMPFDYDWVRIGEGSYKSGFYNDGSKEIFWSVDHLQFPCKDMAHVLFPITFFDAKKVYRIL